MIHEEPDSPPNIPVQKDQDHRLRVNGDTILNGLARVISTLFLEVATFTCAPRQISLSSA